MAIFVLTTTTTITTTTTTTRPITLPLAHARGVKKEMIAAPIDLVSSPDPTLEEGGVWGRD